MKKSALLKEFDSDLKEGNKGLKISLIVLIILTIIPTYYSISTFGFSNAMKILFRPPSTEVDFFALLSGIIIFIAIPFTISIYASKFKK